MILIDSTQPPNNAYGQTLHAHQNMHI